MEYEFIALDKYGEEAEWLRHFLEDILRWPKPCLAICIHYGSQYAIGKAQGNIYNGKSRHIRRRHNTIRQLLSTKVISVDYVKSNDNIKKPATKELNRDLVEKSSRGIRLKPMKQKVFVEENPTQLPEDSKIKVQRDNLIIKTQLNHYGDHPHVYFYDENSDTHKRKDKLCF